MQNEKFSLTPILNENNEYSLKRFNEVEEACKLFIQERVMEEVKDQITLKQLKKNRQELRKKKEDIKKTRINLVKTFSFQFVTLEKMLEQADDELKALKEDYEKSLITTEEIKTQQELKTVILKNVDSTTLNKIIKIATDSGCEIEIKEN